MNARRPHNSRMGASAGRWATLVHVGTVGSIVVVVALLTSCAVPEPRRDRAAAGPQNPNIPITSDSPLTKRFPLNSGRSWSPVELRAGQQADIINELTRQTPQPLTDGPYWFRSKDGYVAACWLDVPDGGDCIDGNCREVRRRNGRWEHDMVSIRECR
jgi:hypothetical protein